MLDDEFQIAKLHLEEGDVLIVRVAHTLTHEMGARIQADVERMVAGFPVMVIDKDFDLSVLRKVEDAP